MHTPSKSPRMLRSDIDNDVSKSMVELMTVSLKKRKAGRAVRFIYNREMPENIKNLLMKKLKLF